jgi:effector-binding domain-containing protein
MTRAESFVLRFSSLSIVAVCALSSGPRLAAQTPTAAEILAKAAKHGRGGRTIGKIENLVEHGTCTFALVNEALSGGQQKGPFAQYLDASGKAYSVTDFKGYGKFEDGTDGRIAWQVDPMSGTRILVGAEEAQYLRLNAMAIGDEPWQDYYDAAALIGTESVGGREQFVLDMKPKLGASETWYVDKERSQVTRVRMTMVLQSAGEEEVMVTYADYRPVDGILRAFKKTIEFSFARLEFQSDRIVHNTRVPADRYDLPDGVMDEVARLAKQALTRDLETGAQAEGSVSVMPLERKNTAVIRVQCAPSEIGANMGMIIPEVYRYVQEVGATAAGPPFARHYESSGATVDFEAGVPVVEPVAGKGRIKPGTLPGGDTATIVHVGPYQELPRSYAVLEEWFETHGREVGDAMWEVYLTDPGVEPDPQKWRSQVFWAIK